MMGCRFEPRIIDLACGTAAWRFFDEGVLVKGLLVRTNRSTLRPHPHLRMAGGQQVALRSRGRGTGYYTLVVGTRASTLATSRRATSTTSWNRRGGVGAGGVAGRRA